MSTSSSSTAISGLGITFHPSPIQLSSPAAAAQPKATLYDADRRPHPEQQQRRPQSVSYDINLVREREERQHRDVSAAMVREASDDSGESGQRRVRIAVGTPEVFGGRKEQEQVYRQPLPQALSPFSDSNSSSSDSQGCSPASLSSLPSSTNSASAYQPQYYSHNQLRHAQSMGALPYLVPESNPYPPQPRSTQPYSRLPYDSSSTGGSQSSNESRSSRLPAFLRERTLKKEALSRPKSMLELGEMYALQSIERRSQVPEMVHSRHYGGGVGAERTYGRPEDGLEELEEEDEDEDPQDQRYGDESPESMPSSAGGLQRRQLERQLHMQHALHQEELRRQSSNLSLNKQLPAHPTVNRQLTITRTRSASAGASLPGRVPQHPRPRPQSEHVMMRSFSSMQGLEPAETGGSFVRLDVLGQRFEEGEQIDPRATSDGMRSGEETVVLDEDVNELRRSGTVIAKPRDGALGRQPTLLTAGANPTRRSKELDRLLAPTAKKIGSSSSGGLATIAGSPTFSASSNIAPSTHQRTTSHASLQAPAVSVIPVTLEQAKSTSKARVELDLVLQSSLVIEGGTLKGRMEVRIRKPKDREKEVWVGKPKIRVIGFEELSSQDARHIFYHHASSISSISSSSGAPLPLPCFDSNPDSEGFSKGLTGQHTVPFSMLLPIGQGAKGGFKGKQGVVRYIVIASVKLKSENGGDRSIAHFYRHVEIFPYFSPAIVLAPALKPLLATGSKALFMGGNGKVMLTAKMHRGTWVAGQRCYVDVSVENESSKKIKTLTLSLVRTTTVFRPRPWLDAGNGHDPDAPGELDLDPDACQTQTTRKKVAESTLEMGKKGNKGVTAKGSWMGVDGGETADFSHFLLVPSDELSIPRGRHLEVTYAIKASVGGTLSADVSADIPVRIVNFVSLDPPPGHVGPIISVDAQARPLSKSWSIDQLRGGAAPKGRAEAVRQQGSSIGRMASLDSLRLSDLNGGRGPSQSGGQTLSRIASLDSLRTSNLSHDNELAAPANPSPPPTLGRGTVVVGKAKERQLVHQMSLDCISSAIASATARRGEGGHRRTESGLRSEISGGDDERYEDEDDGDSRGAHEDSQYYGGGGGEQEYDSLAFQMYGQTDAGSSVQLDDLDDVPDDQAYLEKRHGVPAVEVEDESEDELDALMQSRFDEDDPTPFDDSLRFALRAPPSPHRPSQPTASASRSPVPVRSRPASPIKSSVAASAPPMPKSAMKQPFAYATPASPVKSNSPLSTVPPAPSPRKVAPSATARPLSTRPTSRTATPSPILPAAAAGARLQLTKQSSVSSLKRAPAILKKASSVRSLRAAVSPTTSEGSPAEPALDSSPATSSPDFSSTRTPPSSHEGETRAPFNTSPRKVRAHPPLLSSRSIGNLRALPTPPPARRSTLLPSVRSKVAALESRQAVLNRLTGSTTPAAANGSLSRADSVSGSEASFKLGDLERANSMVSFKAPMLRKRHMEV